LLHHHQFQMQIKRRPKLYMILLLNNQEIFLSKKEILSLLQRMKVVGGKEIVTECMDNFQVIMLRS